MSRYKQTSIIDHLMGIECQNSIQFFYDTPRKVIPRRDFWSNWHCLSCGAKGKINVKYKSTVRDRIRAHKNCRCKA